MTGRKMTDEELRGDSKAFERKLPWGDFLERMGREIPGQVNSLFPHYHYHPHPSRLHPLDPVSALSDLVMMATPSPGRVAKIAINMVPRTYGDLMVGFDPAIQEEEALAREGLAASGITNPGIARSGLVRLLKDKAQEYMDNANHFLTKELKLPEMEREAPMGDFAHELSRDQMTEYMGEKHKEDLQEKRQMDAEKVLESILRPHREAQRMSMLPPQRPQNMTPANQDMLNLYEESAKPKR